LFTFGQEGRQGDKMNKKTVAALTLATIMATTGAVTLSAKDGKGEEKAPQYHSSIQADKKLENEAALQKLAKITLEDAVRAAQGAAPGTITESGIENEDGNVVYTVEVRSGNSTSEVIVDAGNGKVLAVVADADSEGSEGGNEQD
jgi:uncharacterized membrane protein YkoI